MRRSAAGAGRLRSAAGAAALTLAVAAASPGQAQIVINNGGAYALNVVSYRDIPFRTVVRQRYDFSCGSAALATLLRHHYGRDVTEADVFNQILRAWLAGAHHQGAA